jgi:hypothetical protein
MSCNKYNNQANELNSEEYETLISNPFLGPLNSYASLATFVHVFFADVLFLGQPYTFVTDLELNSFLQLLFIAICYLVYFESSSGRKNCLSQPTVSL